MSNVFLVGPLDYGPLLESLLGHRPTMTPACAASYRVCSARGGRQATLWPEEDQCGPGHLIELTNEKDMGLLEFFAAGLGLIYRKIEAKCGDDMIDVATFVDFPTARCTPWDPEAWRRDWAPILTRATLEVKDHFGQIDAPSLVSRMPTILARAASFVAGQDAAEIKGQGPSRVDVIAHNRPYTGFFSFQEYDLSYERFDGAMGPVLSRGVLVAQDAAIILPYDPVRDVVLLVEQFRIGPFARGDKNAWLLEPVAGIVDPGETPQDAARRETREEAGVELDALVTIGGAYPSPGSSTDYFHNFIGLCALPQTAAVIGGLDSEGEDIRGLIIPADELFELAKQGKLTNGPLYLLALWLELNRATLRANA